METFRLMLSNGDMQLGMQWMQLCFDSLFPMLAPSDMHRKLQAAAWIKPGQAWAGSLKRSFNPVAVEHQQDADWHQQHQP